MTRSSNPYRLRRIVLALLVAVPGAAFADALTDQAKVLIDQGNSQAAYDLLIPQEAQRAGEEAYDLLLGVAAADIGRSTNAVFALERVLAVNPNNARARAEIARAYFALGEVKTAREEFDTVKKQGVPPEVEKTIERFMTAVARLDEADQMTLKAYVEGSVGWDSNANGATKDSQVAVPGFAGTFTLNDAGTKQSDGYFGLAAGVNARIPLDPRMALLAGASVNQRLNDTWNEFDTQSLDGSLGVAVKDDKDLYTITAQGGTFWYDKQRYRNTYGLSAQWQHNYNQRTQGTAFVQYAEMHHGPGAGLYGSPANERDARRWTVGVGGAHALQDFKTVLYASVYAGIEDAYLQETAALDQNIYGVRGGAQYQWQDDISLFANTSFETRRNKDDDVSFATPRADQTVTLSLGVTYQPTKQWRITPQYQYVDNRSNIAVFAYQRDVVSLTARYEF